ncbi:MAG: hypothetical protein J0H98_08205 [Solirubrobacterales bacterium]|nr:hypothetical protein [Solirubrobacterales bacterium]
MNRTKLRYARKRRKYTNRRAIANHDKALRYRAAADVARANDRPRRAAKRDRVAQRCSGRAQDFSEKSQWWVGQIKMRIRKIEHLEKSVAEKQAEAEAWRKKHKVKVDGNKVTGGTRRQRLKVAQKTAVANCASGKQNNYYSMHGGPRDYQHTLEGYAYGRIWDCSTYGDGLYLVCGLEAPSGPNTPTAGGYTGTQGANGRIVKEADAKCGDLVLYGPYPHHHVEIVDDPDRKTTTGHGSAPIDAGIFDLFGDGDYVIRRYLND